METSIVIGGPRDFSAPPRIAISPDGQTIYYTDTDGVYSLDITATTKPTTALINRSFYGLEVNPDGQICALSSPGFTINGQLVRYESNGTLIDSMEVGIGPNGAMFN